MHSVLGTLLHRIALQYTIEISIKSLIYSLHYSEITIWIVIYIIHYTHTPFHCLRAHIIHLISNSFAIQIKCHRIPFQYNKKIIAQQPSANNNFHHMSSTYTPFTFQPSHRVNPNAFRLNIFLHI